MSLIEESCKEGVLNHNDKFTVETTGEHSPSSTEGIYGDPLVLPRLGDQYQVEIPPLISETEHLQPQNILIDNVDDIVYDFYTWEELAIPIIWYHCFANHIGRVQELLGMRIGSETVQSHATAVPPVAACNLGISDDQIKHDEHFACLTNQKCGTPDKSRKTGDWIPLPGSPKSSWSDSESQSFLLALYIFGKNLVQVQRFVDSKDMGDVLSFYYGKFYRSDAQCKWMECKKIRSRKSIIGHRIFTGCRQQELLSRLLPNRPKEVQDTLLEVTKGFNEGTASLEEFTFTLKALVGNEALVDAVGIGKGKQDLTRITLDHVRANQIIPSRLEIPAGKACSSLTSEEIIKFLTGDFRLSKAKSNDLFWEAVWPRLLARGWHSEQPKDISVISSKNALVFLIPGIKKFSRKKLSRGNHYFDSVSDVLNKVASDPTLLEFEAEQGKEIKVIETVDTKVVHDGVSDNHRPCYLHLPLPHFSSDLMKFTIVDTSLAYGGKPSKVRELRSLPADSACCYRPNCPRVANSDSSSEQSSSGDASLNSQVESDRSLHDAKKDTDPKPSLPGNGHNLVGDGCEINVDKLPLKCTKFKFNHRVKSRKQNSLTPFSKRPRLSSCRSVGTGSGFFRLMMESPFQTELLETSEEADVDDSMHMEEIEGVISHGKSQPRTFIDLNLQPMDFDSEGPLDREVEGNQYDLKPKESFEANAVLADESVVNGRRHSTRTRPPTTKALEALACGFLSVRKERSTKASRSSSFTSRSTRRAHKNVEASLPASETKTINPNPSTVDPSVGTDEEYSGSSSHTSSFDNSHELLGLL